MLLMSYNPDLSFIAVHILTASYLTRAAMTPLTACPVSVCRPPTGQWQKCIETAKQHGPQVLHKYLALYAAHLIKVSESSCCRRASFARCFFLE